VPQKSMLPFITKTALDLTEQKEARSPYRAHHGRHKKNFPKEVLFSSFHP
jgi:hypothetical protein